MRESDKFRENAVECERMATKSPRADDRDSFAKMAREWRDLERTALVHEAARIPESGQRPHEQA